MIDKLNRYLCLIQGPPQMNWFFRLNLMVYRTGSSSRTFISGLVCWQKDSFKRSWMTLGKFFKRSRTASEWLSHVWSSGTYTDKSLTWLIYSTPTVLTQKKTFSSLEITLTVALMASK
jgi:hypothetical protein